jgi:hypothetical protein
MASHEGPTEFNTLVFERSQDRVESLKKALSIHTSMAALSRARQAFGRQVRMVVQGEVKKCRVPLIREEEQRAWLACKLNGAAELETLELRTERPLY